MKNFRLIILLALCFSCATIVTSCGSQSTDNATEQGTEYTSAYICPMYCTGSGSDAPGKCPVCSMDYVAKDDDEATEDHGHDHNHDHGHDHSHGHSH